MATPKAPSLRRRGLAFLAGASFAGVPTLGPYVALLAIASGRLELQRADRWWWFSALLLGTPWIVTGHVWAGIGATAQVVAVWLIFRAAAAVRRSIAGTQLSFDVAAGLLVGFAAALTFGLGQSAQWRIEPARSVLDVFAWSGNPALFGHAMVLLAALLAVVVPSAALRTVALALGALAALASGAHEAVLAWLLVAVGLRLLRRRGTRTTVGAEWALIAVMLFAASGLGESVGLGRTGFRFDLVAPAAGANLFRGTEASGEWWYPLGVSATETQVRIDGVDRTGFAVTKTDPAAYARLQQIVELRPQREYVLAVSWAIDDAVQPGLDGWGVSPGGGRDANLAATYRNGSWLTNATQHFTILGADVSVGDDGWAHGHVAFRYQADAPLVWYVGAVPDRSTALGATTTFAKFQLIEGAEVLPYVPNASDVRLADLRAARLPMWREAVQAIAQRPWLGWGPTGFQSATEALQSSESRFRPVAAHAHSLVLDTWLERGVMGLVGLLLLAGALALRTLQQRDRAMAIVLAAVVVLNLFETTLLNGALIYPLAAMLGWRAVGAREVAQTQTGYGSAGAVRVALAASDVLVAATAISLGLAAASADAVEALVRGWSNPALVYATLLWPAFAWWSGLYPGYGRAAHDELARSVRAAAAATVSLGFIAFALPGTAPLGTGAIVLVGVVAVVLAPLARLLTKQGLRSARLWGRPVVILGTGERAEQVARYLADHPGVGLHPIAAFGDPGRRVGDLPITAGIDDAWDFLRDHAIHHVIVTPDAGRRIGYDEVLRRAEPALRFVQFVPDLHGVPASSVVAAPLGTSLGLQVRNQLASRTNRVVKRAMDVAGAAAILALLSPALLAIGIWIRFDSRGPALYLAQRVGRYGAVFRCVKFRTMHADAEARLEHLLAGDPALRDEYERFHKLTDDPRVTRAGQLLRRFSIDEFPQLFNVLAGHMSLVGPRPYLVRELEQMGSERDLIVLARPGMTGYWQVEGRNDVTFEERQAMEAAYVRNWSVWWDLEILFRTPLALLERTGR